MTISEHIAQLKEYFALLPSWEEKYEYIISLGEEMASLDKRYKTDEYLLHGCQSRVWLRSYEEHGRVYFEADSDSVITKGIIALLLMIFSGQSREDIAQSTMDFLEDLGLPQHLSLARVNGLHAMVQKIQQS